MLIAAIHGHPVAHSRSPLIHGWWLRAHGLSGAYLRRDIAPEDFAATMKRLGADGFVGGNVTIPHKEAVLAIADETTPAARAIGAANTVWLEGDRLHADNTDVLGFMLNLDEQAPGWSRADRPALVIGAGGAARAILHGLLERGVGRIMLANRGRDRAEALARDFGPRVVPIGLEDMARHVADAGLVVNTTALGMKGQPALDLDLGGCRDDLVVADCVYAPLETQLLASARRRGLRVADGLGMLLHQAGPGFERWFGVRPTVTPDLRAVVVADLGPAA